MAAIEMCIFVIKIVIMVRFYPSFSKASTFDGDSNAVYRVLLSVILRKL